VSSTACMAGRWRGSPAVRWSRPWRREVRRARGLQGQGGREIGGEGSNSHGGRARRPWCRRERGNASPGLTAAKTMAKVQAELEVEEIDEWWCDGGAGRRRVGRRRAAVSAPARLATATESERASKEGSRAGRVVMARPGTYLDAIPTWCDASERLASHRPLSPVRCVHAASASARLGNGARKQRGERRAPGPLDRGRVHALRWVGPAFASGPDRRRRPLSAKKVFPIFIFKPFQIIVFKSHFEQENDIF
jgi:hypothetical protein